jgi:hypothetical protein
VDRERGAVAVDEADLTLKLTITRKGHGQYQSHLDCNAVGISDVSDFDLAETQINTWISMVEENVARHSEMVELGKRLFELTIKDNVRNMYERCLGFAKANNARLRIAMSIRPNELISAPWEYMHDDKLFLLKHGHAIVRIIDELAQQEAIPTEIKHLLVAVANPKVPEQNQFNAEEHVDQLVKALGCRAEVDVLRQANSEKLRAAILSSKHDALYFVGHGQFSESLEGQLVLEGADGAREYLRGDDLAQWTRDATIRFAYLNACLGARTSVVNPMAGIAQRLMFTERLHGVIAMQASIAQRLGLVIAEEYFRNLQEGYSMEKALARSRTIAVEDQVSWGIPVVYTFLRPEAYNGASHTVNRVQRSEWTAMLPASLPKAEAPESVVAERERIAPETIDRSDMMSNRANLNGRKLIRLSYTVMAVTVILGASVYLVGRGANVADKSGTVPASNAVHDDSSAAAVLTDKDLEVTRTSFAYQVIKPGNSTLHVLLDALESEGLAERKDSSGFVILAVEIRPFSANKKSGALQVIIRGDGAETSGYCVVRKPDGWVGKDHNRIYRAEGMAKVRVPECNKDESLLLLVRLKASKKALPKTDAEIRGYLQLRVIEI